MVRGEGPEKVTVNIPYKINRDTKEKSVKTRSENKDYRRGLSYIIRTIVYNKRVIVNNFDTLPKVFKLINDFKHKSYVCNGTAARTFGD